MTTPKKNPFDKFVTWMKLPLENQIFPGYGTEEDNADDLGVTVLPGSVEMQITIVDDFGFQVVVKGVPRAIIRRDTGKFRLCVEMILTAPGAYKGKFGQMWHAGDTLRGQGVFMLKEEGEALKKPCPHVWETLEDGSKICFECDERRPAEEGEA